MTLQECYEMLHGNYDDAKRRLMNDRLVEKFMLRFPEDNSITILRDAVSAQDIETSFRGAHTLKGVAANLSFTELQKAASDLTEQLRPLISQADPELLSKVEESYALVIKTIKAYKEQ